MGKYEVKIIESKGACKSSLFEKMAMKGDITSTKVSDVVGKVFAINGYSLCHIDTDETSFDLTYFTTKEGTIISSGSEIFKESVIDYMGEVEKMRIEKIKTKKGYTYKAVPVLEENEETTKKNDEETTNEEDLPF